MKNNTFKRVMAGTLAVLTVASPMTANVGGFLTGSVAIVASADEVAAPSTAKYNVTWTNAAKYLTKYTEDYVDTALTDVNIETGLDDLDERQENTAADSTAEPSVTEEAAPIETGFNEAGEEEL